MEQLILISILNHGSPLVDSSFKPPQSVQLRIRFMIIFGSRFVHLWRKKSTVARSEIDCLALKTAPHPSRWAKPLQSIQQQLRRHGKSVRASLIGLPAWTLDMSKPEKISAKTWRTKPLPNSAKAKKSPKLLRFRLFEDLPVNSTDYCGNRWT